MKSLLSIILTVVVLTVSGQKSPEQDAIFEKIVKEYTLNKDGSIDFHYYKKLKLLTHFSFNRLYGETFIVFNPDHQQLKINVSRTVQEGGKVIETPANAFNEVLPRAAANAPYYNGLREMVVTHTGLEVNAIIELDYTLHSDAGYLPALMGNDVISESSPIRKEVVIINIPAGKKLNYRVFNVRTSPQINEKDGMKIYTFTFSGIPERSHENFQPAFSGNLPRLTFSTENMETVYRYLTKQDAFSYKTDKSMDDAVAEIIKDAKSDLMTALKIQEMVVNDVNYYHLDQQYSGWKIRNPVDVRNSNGGAQFEKAVLMAALLRKAGINAVPVITFPSKFYDESVGCLNLITEYLVQVNPRETGQLYLSPTGISSQNLIYKSAAYTVIALNPDKPLRVEKIGVQENILSLTGSITFDDSLKMTGNAELLLTNRINPYFEPVKDSAYAKRLVSGKVSSFELKNLSQSRTTATYKFEDENPLKGNAGYYTFKLPECDKGTGSWRLHYLLSKRETPLEIPFTIDESYGFTVTLPEGATLLNPVKKTEMKDSFGEMMIEISQTGSKVTVKRSVKVTEKTIQPAFYKKFKEMIDLWNERKFKVLTIKKL
jgi:hypothetical protein